MAVSSSVTKAITTPLASIFGSGFLIIVPILAGAVGRHSVIAMVGDRCAGANEAPCSQLRHGHSSPLPYPSGG
jgi:hypothetical protein